MPCMLQGQYFNAAYSEDSESWLYFEDWEDEVMDLFSLLTIIAVFLYLKWL